MTFFYVCCGGAIGALGRYWLTTLISKKIMNNGSLLATFTINVIGSYLLGVLLNVFEGRNESSITIGITVGILGAFTTYSTFSLDSLRLMKERQWLQFCLYSIGTILLCVGAFILGTISL